MTKRKATRHVLLPDIHHPYHDVKSLAAVMGFLKWFKPDEVILLGDAMDMQAVSHWLEDRGQRRKLENLRIREEYEAFDAEVLSEIEAICPSAKKVYMGGNHEQWAVQLVDKDPKLEGMVEPEICLNLADRGWEWIPYLTETRSGDTVMGQYRIGKLLVFHGVYTNKYHAAKTVGAFSRSCAYGHTHDVQVYAEAHVDDPRSYHTAQSIGCLCRKSPDYLRGLANKWVTSFGIAYVRPDGNYSLYVPIIINGKFTFANKEFGA